MKIKIEDDLFDIVKRIKEIDDGYFVLFDIEKGRYEIHNSKQKQTHCLNVNGCELNSCVIDLILKTNVAYIDHIIEDIDNNNKKHEQKEQDMRKSYSDYMVREIYDFCSNSSKEFKDEMFQTEWR